ncbi:Paraquat-inducible protein B [hydrothermal vent metagenome]|uniref:Paraquat-inducible protein B n=1 Tax=hydrothermal vent metagenome TaxID=652676 RepID=A0A3B1BH80_9ZZZZ
MIKNANSTVIGSFIVGAVILIVVVFLVFGSGKLFVTTNQFVIYFRSSPQGLSIGAPVKLKGVKVGEVTKITPIYDTKGTFNVEVIIEIMEGVVKRIGDENPQETPQQKVKNLVAKGLKAQLESESMVTGKLYVKMDFFPNEEVILEGHNTDLVEIPSIPNAFELLEKDAKRIFDRLGKIEFEKISDNLNNLLVSSDSLIRDPSLYESFDEMAENLRLSQKFILDLDSSLAPITEGFTEVTASTNETLKEIQKLMIRLESVTANNRYELHQLLKEFRKTSESMRNLTDYLQRDPSSPFYGK